MLLAYTTFQNCLEPNYMDCLPKLQCPYELQGACRKKTYSTILLLRALIFLATHVAVSITSNVNIVK